MRSIASLVSFYFALFTCALIPSFLCAILLERFLPAGLVTDANLLLVILAMSAVYLVVYSLRRGTQRRAFWRNDALIPASKKFAVGHLGTVFIAIATAAMINAKSGSGVVLAPAAIWIFVFYRQGFKSMAVVLGRETEGVAQPLVRPVTIVLFAALIVLMGLLTITGVLK